MMENVERPIFSPRYSSAIKANKRLVAGKPCLTRALKRPVAAPWASWCLCAFWRGEKVAWLLSERTVTCVVWLQSPFNLSSPIP